MPRLTPTAAALRRTSAPAAQRGVASLIVVMVLFFAVAMVAAYTNRSLLFEQRTSANQARSTRALEAADAGLEWALSMLNSGRTTAACTLSALDTDTTFRQRYLVINPDDGNIVPKKRSDGVTDLYPTCVNTGGVWSCSCPADGAPALAATEGHAFRVRFRRVCASLVAPDTACATPTQPGIVHIDVNGCTTPNDDCLRFDNEATPGKPLVNEGRTTVHVIAALMGALPNLPGAALTVRGDLNVGAAALQVVNSETHPAAAPNVTMHLGGAFNAAANPGVVLIGPGGTPGDFTKRTPDAVLNALSPDRFFQNTFGMGRGTYREQPAMVVVDCTATCNAATVAARATMNPGRMLLLDGDVVLDAAATIGTEADPIVLNVTGSLSFGAPATINGLVYSQAASWTANGAGQIVGAAIAEGHFTGAPANTTITYSAPVLKRLRTQTGSFIKLPGSWKDFES